MRLPQLDTRLPLERGEALTAAVAIGNYLALLLATEQAQRRIAWQLLLTIAPLYRLRRRLLTRHQSEQRPVQLRARPISKPKPRLLRVPVEELVALRECQAVIQRVADDAHDVVYVLGKFHEASTGLEAYIGFSAQ